MKKSIIAIMILLCLGLGGFLGFLLFSEDKKAPEIQFQDNEIMYTAGDSYDGLLDGVTAMDNKDGDVTASLVVESVYPNEDGTTATVVYVARDSSNNVGKATKMISYQSADQDSDSEEEAAESDQENMTEQEKTAVPTPAVTQEPSVTPEAEDEVDDSEEEETLSSENPKITLTTDRVVIRKGETINRIAYVESVTDDKDSRETLYRRIEIKGDTFNNNEEGTYEQIYYVIDTDGNRSNEAKLTIVVQ